MKKNFKILTACLAFLFLFSLAFGVKVEAARKGQIEVTNGVVTSTVKKAHVVNLVNNETIENITLTKGIYYFDATGKLANLTADTVLPYYVSIDASAGTTKLVTKGAFKKTGASYSSPIALFNGQWYEGGKYYACSSGSRGSLSNGVITGQYYNAGTKTSGSLGSGKYVVNGVLTTAVVNLRLYLNGSYSTYTGWNKIGGNIYYFKSGQAVTGWNYLPSYGKGVKRYTYLFNNKGVLYTDLVWGYYGYKNFISKKIKIIVNKKTHNTTFYLQDGSGNYTIPALTVVCATAKKKGDTPNGTFRLEKTWNKRWYVYTKTNGAPYRYYQWAVKIHHTSSLFHSSTYRKKSAKSLRVDLYNKLGTSCTTHCVRHQARYAKLIYDIATYKIKVKKWRKTRIPVQIITSPNEGPFGHVGHTKVKKGTKWDPTDPNKK